MSENEEIARAAREWEEGVKFEREVYHPLSEAVFELTRTRGYGEESDKPLTGEQRDEIFTKLQIYRDAFKRALSGRMTAQRALFNLRQLYDYYDGEHDLENPYRNRYVAFAFGVIEEARPYLEQAAEKHWIDQKDLLSAYYRMSKNGNDQQVSVGLEGLGSHLDFMRKRLDDGKEQSVQRFLKAVLCRASPDRQDAAAGVIRDFLEKNPDSRHIPLLISTLFDSE
ncbi:MAG: hypothetical protein AAB871_02675, partial [Patescibacteria group bacterium]